MNTNKPLIQYYDDPTFYFTFAGVYSGKYNLFLTSTSVQKVVVSKGATTNYATPMYGNGAYLLGTNRTQMQFQYNVAAEGMDRDTLNEIMLWLEEGTTGFLVNDDNPWWGYDVVLEKVGDVTWTGPRNYGVVEFQLTFKTYGDFCAKALVNASYNWDTNHANVSNWTQYASTTTKLENGTIIGSNEYNVPELYYQLNRSEDSDVFNNKYGTLKLRIVQIGNKHLYFQYGTSIDTLNSKASEYVFSIKNLQDNTNLVYYKFKNNPSQGDLVIYLSQYGFLYTGENLLELDSYYDILEGSVIPSIVNADAPIKCDKTLNNYIAYPNKVAIDKNGAAVFSKCQNVNHGLTTEEDHVWIWDTTAANTFSPIIITNYTELECTIGENAFLILYKHNNL